MEKTFAELFCSHRHLPPEHYQKAMLRCCLYRRALIVRPVLALMAPRFFAADGELIARVGVLTTPEALDDEIDDFYHHDDNRSFLRRVLYLRVSGRRVRRLFGRLMPAAAPPAPDETGGAEPDGDGWSALPWRIQNMDDRTARDREER